jgi:soluble lytic murein transglycosylase
VALTFIFARPILIPVLVGLLLQHGPAAPDAPQLLPTAHPAVPASLEEIWLVPPPEARTAKATAAYAPLTQGLARYRRGEFTAALPLFANAGLASSPLGNYARYYIGMTELRMGRHADARRTFESLVQRKPEGHLAIAAALGAGEAAEAAKDFNAAVQIYEGLATDKTAVSEEAVSRLGRAALAAGDRRKAAAAYSRVYYEFPLTAAATAAGAQLTGLEAHVERRGHDIDLGRAQVLFGARRYAEARTAFADVRRHTSGDERDLVDLRIAQSDFHLRRWPAARDGLRPLLDRGPVRAEARYFHLAAIRELGDHGEFVRLTRALVREFPDSPWAEEALNGLGTHYILVSQDDQAAEVFGELFRRFPAGARAERAAWKYGWWKYKTGGYAEAARVFEQASANFPRSDYRPSFLYWAGRSHGRLGARGPADARMRLVYTDYGNSYYGRLAERTLRASNARTADLIVPASSPPVMASDTPVSYPNSRTIRLLLAAGLYDEALSELRHAQRVAGPSPVIDATIAWTFSRQGELRRGINLMRRTYPQFLTASGQQDLPTEILEVIFPLTYWDSIQRHSKVHGLDPYLVAALIAQESTFDPRIKSPANAVGLMQIVPATGRRMAQAAGLRKFTPAMLTDPEINLRLGTLYFARLVKQFGGTHYALASYNAGENRIVRWKAERPGIDQDEFIDDIPFPETQNYVKRILGTAENYRMLYAGGGGRPQPVHSLQE